MPRDYEWLIKSRSEIQASILDLYRLLLILEKQPDASAPNRSCFGLLVGAAFALWRGAFLEDASREWTDILRDARQVLEKLLENNSIVYSDERTTRQWMGGYYLNNARYRLLRLGDKLGATALDDDTAAALDKLRESGWSEGTTPQQAWDTAHRAFLGMSRVLHQKLEGH